MWYQHLFQIERGREALQTNRHALCRLLWQQWSPTWHFDDAMFGRTAPAFDNPDFVDLVIHAYRFSFGLATGDPAYAPLEARLREKPKIRVPAVPHEHRTIGCGHNLPRERPDAFVNAIMRVLDMSTAGIWFAS